MAFGGFEWRRKLVKIPPLTVPPLKKIIEDLSDTEKVLVGLDLQKSKISAD